MNIQEYIELVRKEVLKATADAAGPTSGISLTVYLDDCGNVTQEHKKACTVEMHVHYSEACVRQAMKQKQDATL
jgi:hypothetical protein